MTLGSFTKQLQFSPVRLTSLLSIIISIWFPFESAMQRVPLASTRTSISSSLASNVPSPPNDLRPAAPSTWLQRLPYKSLLQAFESEAKQHRATKIMTDQQKRIDLRVTRQLVFIYKKLFLILTEKFSAFNLYPEKLPYQNK